MDGKDEKQKLTEGEKKVLEAMRKLDIEGVSRQAVREVAECAEMPRSTVADFLKLLVEKKMIGKLNGKNGKRVARPYHLLEKGKKQSEEKAAKNVKGFISRAEHDAAIMLEYNTYNGWKEQYTRKIEEARSKLENLLKGNLETRLRSGINEVLEILVLKPKPNRKHGL